MIPRLTESLAVIGFVTLFLLLTNAVAPYVRAWEARWVGWVEKMREREPHEYLLRSWTSDGCDRVREELKAQRDAEGWLKREDFR